MIRERLLGVLAGAAILAGPAGAGHAQTRADQIPLGVSSSSGAVCEAVRDYDDPVIQAAGRRAWNIRCRGWETSLGRLYALPDAGGAAAWNQSLATRATCAETKPESLAGLGSVNRRACKNTKGGAAYLAYDAKKGPALYTAEGASQIADVLEIGLKVVSGAAKPPKASDMQVSAASAEIASDFGGSAGGLAHAQAAAATDPARLRAAAYVRNNEWRFDQAETDFQALVADAEARHAPPREMAEALLNLALNISNNGRFTEADRLFDDAAIQVDAAGDPLLASQLLGYRALHLRNQGKFAEAVSVARGALAARNKIRASRGIAPGGPAVAQVDGGVAIGGDLALALNGRTAGGNLLSGGGAVSVADQLQVQDAQSLEVIGSSLEAQGELAPAREALTRASQTLALAEANGAINIWLRARIEADLADLDMDAHNPAAAADRLANAVQIMRRRHAGASSEAGLLLQLGHAQAAAGRDDAALATFSHAFEVFQTQRGSLGASADDAAPYFDLLLTRIKSDPARADAYRAQFFTAAESVVSNATAQTVSKLAARVASGDGAITGLVRALDDTRRELNAAEARIATMQSQGTYVGEDKTNLDAQLKALQTQSDALETQLLAANPRYAQLVSSSATLADLQKALRSDEIYLKLVLLGDRGYGVLVSKQAATPYAIGLSRGEAAAAVRRLRTPFESQDVLPEYDVAGAYKLFTQLFGPVSAQVLAAKHLLYEPDGALISLPVAALVARDPAPVLADRVGNKEVDYRKVAWVGAQLDSSLVLSASSFLQSRNFAPSRAKENFLAFADPATPHSGPRAFASIVRRGAGANAGISACEGTRQALMGLADLPDTADEVHKVSASFGGRGEDLVIGQAFTDAAIKSRADLGDFKVLYFATHGLLPQPSGCLPQPALVTSLGDGDSDGLLDASEILDLKLDADLVVLSACDTGGAGADSADVTGLQGSGEALGGLTRAVIYAGGRSLIVSHWSIDSAATVRLMTGLFAASQSTQAEGLQKAQLALQQSADWSHPYFWAPFTIIGDGSRPVPSSARAGS